jgi:hypothetical protein
MFATLLITAIGLFYFFQDGFSIFSGILWLKIATNALTWYFINSSKAKEFFYYQNLGVSKRLLWSSTLSFDFSLFFFSIALIHYSR